jgi:hypothetical protein
LAEHAAGASNLMNPNMTTFTQPFAQWLKKSTSKLTETKDAK